MPSTDRCAQVLPTFSYDHYFMNMIYLLNNDYEWTDKHVFNEKCTFLKIIIHSYILNHTFSNCSFMKLYRMYKNVHNLPYNPSLHLQ